MVQQTKSWKLLKKMCINWRLLLIWKTLVHKKIMLINHLHFSLTKLYRWEKELYQSSRIYKMEKRVGILSMNGFCLQLNFGHLLLRSRIWLTFKLCNNLEKMRKLKLKLISLYRNTMKNNGKMEQEKILKMV